MNLMAFDAMALGNHEFDKGTASLRDFIGAATFPVIGANVDASADPNLKGLIKGTVIKTVGGREVAIIGLVTPKTATISLPGDKVSFSDAVTAANAAVKAAKARGVEIIVLVTHLGFATDVILANSVSDVDVIVGGHTHTLFGDLSGLGLGKGAPYPFTTKGVSGQTVCIVQAWANTRVVGALRVELDDAGKVQRCSGAPHMAVGDAIYRGPSNTLVEVTGADKAAMHAAIDKHPLITRVTDDTAASAVLAKYKPGIAALLAEKVADVAEDLYHVTIPGRTHATAGALPGGSQIVPLAADALLWKARALGQPAVIAMVNGGTARKSTLPKGALTFGTVFETLPFGNTLVLLDITGQTLVDLLEDAVDAALTGPGGPFPYVAGVRYKLALTNAKGQRISAVEVQPAAGGAYQPVDAKKTYRAAVASFLSQGSNGYTKLKGAPNSVDTGLDYAEVFVEWARTQKTLSRPTPRQTLQ